MAVVALTNMYTLFNAVDISDHITNSIITANADELDSSAMNAAGWKSYTGALKAGQWQFETLDDFAVASIDSTIWSAFSTGTGIVALEARAVNTPRSTSNPGYTANILVSKFSFGGQLNTMAKKSLTYNLTGALSRQTA